MNTHTQEHIHIRSKQEQKHTQIALDYNIIRTL